MHNQDYNGNGTISRPIFDLSRLLGQSFRDANKPPLNLQLVPQIDFTFKVCQIPTITTATTTTRQWPYIEEEMISPKSKKSTLAIYSKTMQTTAKQLASPESLNYKRVVHLCYHNHRITSTPALAPTTITKSNPNPRTNQEHSQPTTTKPKTLTYAEVARLNTTNHAHIPTVSTLITTLASTQLTRGQREWLPPTSLTPRLLSSALKNWSNQPAFMSNCALREKHNPFTSVPMNEGWNRAKTDLLVYFTDLQGFCPALKGGVEDLREIKEQFASFGFSGQREKVLLDEELLGSMGFGFVFRGVERGCEDRGNLGRRNGGMGMKRLVKSCCKSGCFAECNAKWVESLVSRVGSWDQTRIVGSDGRWKRKRGYYEGWRDFGAPGRQKRAMLKRNMTGRVLSEEWRARRRVQERKRGRWTDGTVRMDKMWDAFYWVLNHDDPLKCRWSREKVCGHSIWV